MSRLPSIHANRSMGSFISSLKCEQRRDFYERNKPIAVFIILIVFIFPILGVFVIGLSGAVLGVVISVLGYYLTPYAVLKLRKGQGRG